MLCTVKHTKANPKTLAGIGIPWYRALMKFLVIPGLLFFVSLPSSAAVPAPLATYTLSSAVHQTRKLAFEAHVGPGEYDTWLQTTLPFGPIEVLRKQIEKNESTILQHRSEAHITVLTPPEWNVLKRVLKIEKLNAQFGKRLQRASFEALCLGKFSLQVEGKNESTYYVVVRSPELVKIRKELQELFVAGGGKPTEFDPLSFFPHITVGFTSRDFHLSDGAAKDARTCVANLEIN
jgi:2'-5' RNA ligase